MRFDYLFLFTVIYLYSVFFAVIYLCSDFLQLFIFAVISDHLHSVLQLLYYDVDQPFTPLSPDNPLMNHF